MHRPQRSNPIIHLRHGHNSHVPINYFTRIAPLNLFPFHYQTTDSENKPTESKILITLLSNSLSLSLYILRLISEHI